MCNHAERKKCRRSAAVVIKLLIRVTFHGCKKILHAAYSMKNGIKFFGLQSANKKWIDFSIAI